MLQTALAVVQTPRFDQILKTGTRLTGSQKAAVIVQALLSQGGRVSLGSLSRSAQTHLAETFSSIEHVDQDVVDTVITEFETELGGDGLRFPVNPVARLSQLSDVLTDDLLDRAGTDLGLAPDAALWRDVAALDTDVLIPVLSSENPRIGAVILSKLPPTRAAELMGELDSDLAKSLAQVISITEDVGVQVAKNIATSLIKAQSSVTDTAFSTNAIGRMAAILDAAKPKHRDQMLADIAADDPEFAKKVRAAIFTFEDIPARVAIEDIAKITRDVPGEDLILALGHGAVNAPDTVKHILGNMSGRMATQLKEDIAEYGAIKLDHGEAAQSRVTTRIREMAENGTLKLSEPVDIETAPAGP